MANLTPDCRSKGCEFGKVYAEYLQYCGQVCGKLRSDYCPVCATLLKVGFMCPDGMWR
ncbi:MAG: hypothetical protein JEZ07_09010 [Phycisphaerae bacterium]|nr:hypothetical protein [Phycisphaerae bacterium]